MKRRTANLKPLPIASARQATKEFGAIDDSILWQSLVPSPARSEDSCTSSTGDFSHALFYSDHPVAYRTAGERIHFEGPKM
jgi:hypothetical protein